MFERTIALFDDYYRKADATNAVGFSRELACEVRERLLQLDFIIERVQSLEETARAAGRRTHEAFTAHIQKLQDEGIPIESPEATFPKSDWFTAEESKAQSAAVFEFKLLTEAFYYFAGRVRTILRNGGAPLPGLTAFECVGVRNTRNKLLEHPEGKDSQVLIQSFAWGRDIGPVIKAIRYGGQEDVFPDRGLYENATEFRENLERLLRASGAMA